MKERYINVSYKYIFAFVFTYVHITKSVMLSVAEVPKFDSLVVSANSFVMHTYG